MRDRVTKTLYFESKGVLWCNVGGHRVRRHEAKFAVCRTWPKSVPSLPTFIMDMMKPQGQLEANCFSLEVSGLKFSAQYSIIK
jgi:hypothetical protein